MEIKVLLWTLYVIGIIVAMILFIDDAYEESLKHGMSPSDYLGRNDVMYNIIFASMGSWIAVFYRWQKKR
jgi:hypothetical protein